MSAKRHIFTQTFAMRNVLAICLSFVLVAPAWAAPVCALREEAAPRLANLQTAMAEGRFVAYQPTALKVWDGVPVAAGEESIRADLATLRPWFDSLITYGAHSGGEKIPALAEELGFRAVIIGIWNPADKAEVKAALTAAKVHPQTVVGISLGNEMILRKDASWQEMVQAISDLRAVAPALPLTTSEPFALFLDDAGAPALLRELDFLAVNIHPVFEPWFRDAPSFNRADFVRQVLGRLADERFCGPVLVKETGVPTAPAADGFSEKAQASFYEALIETLPPSREVAFAFFSAFDAGWRIYDETPVAGHHPQEAHWGLFRENREAKPVMRVIPRLAGEPVNPAPAP